MPHDLFDRLVEVLNASGLRLAVGRITHEFLDFQLTADRKKYSNPELDPTLHQLDESNSFWIELKNIDGETVAATAGRLCQIRSFLPLCENYEFWYGEQIRFTNRLDIVYCDHSRLPKGQVAYDGAMWVRPDYRHRGISWVLSRLCRLTAMHMWEPDWIFGFGFDGITQARIPTTVYGYPNHSVFAHGFKFPGHPAHTIHLSTMTNLEAIHGTIRDQRFLEDCPDLMLDHVFAKELRRRRSLELQRRSIDRLEEITQTAIAS